jgi:hypothetical protein
MWRSIAIGVVLAGVLAGCSLDSPSGAPSGPNGLLKAQAALSLLVADNSTVTVRTLKSGKPVKIVRTQTLRCSPPGGSVSDSVAACRALDDFLSHYRVPHRRSCFEGAHPKPDVVVEVYGRAAGKRVGVAVLTSGRCRFAERWIRDLRTVTGLPGT